MVANHQLSGLVLPLSNPGFFSRLVMGAGVGVDVGVGVGVEVGVGVGVRVGGGVGVTVGFS
ncbi:Uncharacterised protein [uncultured archaeon]|nr:Uncharacterised protein [uncultured archaeon]